MLFAKSKIKGVLLDITGVLYESGQNKAIQGSVEAIEKLRSSNIPFRFVTNETQTTRAGIVSKLRRLRFNLHESEIFSPGLATSMYVKKKMLKPFLLVHPGILPEFEDCDQSSPDCVVVGDAADNFTFQNVNAAFNVLIKSSDPVLISMGKGKYYQENNELCLDLGGYTCLLEYAANVKAKIIGKPSDKYFQVALTDLGIEACEAVMVGDDISSDVCAAQQCGMQGVLVQTGKFRESDISSDMKPNLLVRNLAHFVEVLLS